MRKPPVPHGRRGRGTLFAVAVLFAAVSWHEAHVPGLMAGLRAAESAVLAAAAALAALAALRRYLAGCAPALVPRAARIRERHGRARPATPDWIHRAVLKADRRRCVFCGRRDRLEVDHMRPWAGGGLTALFNLAVLCSWHNRVKSNYSVDRDGYVHYRPFADADDVVAAAAILRAERRCRRSPVRWLRLARAAW